MHYSKLNSIIPTFMIAGCLLLFDLMSKYLIVEQGYFNHRSWITPVFNPGSARSIPVPQIVSIVLALLLIGYIVKYHLYDRVVTFWEWIAYILFIAGALGNTYDRLIYGSVRDFIDIVDRYPIFNIADIYLVGGVLLYLVWMWGWRRQ